jgi:hypothetical protein
VRVVFAPLTKAAYLAAKKQVVVIKPRVTFPLRKQHGRLVIPTAKGPRVFRDGWNGSERDEDTRYTYLGYWPGLCWHVVKGYHYSEVYLQHVVTQRGQQLDLEAAPVFSPDTSQFIVASGALDGLGGPSMQLFRRQQGGWRKVWNIEPQTWQVEQLDWVGPHVLLLQEKHWNKDFSHSWYTYARLAIR